jgi:hypothetical protein
MTEIPMKMSWMGHDVDSLSREELIEVVRQMGRQLESARDTTQTILRMNETFRRAKDHRQS